ncbi:MAG: hypothetical protein PHC61_00910 [Chitinivibrionales bacterium]|nr:hypothetical protein [Chitinivibrionales bacterium]
MNFRRGLVIVLVCGAIGLYAWDALLIFRPSIIREKNIVISLQKNNHAYSSTFLVPGKVRFIEQGRSPFLAFAADALPVTVKKAMSKQKPATEALKPPPMSINGIMWSDKNPIAVIAFGDGSSTLAKKGDVLSNGATISVVEKSRVGIIFQGKPFWIEK